MLLLHMSYHIVKSQEEKENWILVTVVGDQNRIILHWKSSSAMCICITPASDSQEREPALIFLSFLSIGSVGKSTKTSKIEFLLLGLQLNKEIQNIFFLFVRYFAKCYRKAKKKKKAYSVCFKTYNWLISTLGGHFSTDYFVTTIFPV